MSKRILIVFSVIIGMIGITGEEVVTANQTQSESIDTSDKSELDELIEENNLIELDDILTTPAAKSERKGDNIILEVLNENGGLEIQAGDLKPRTEYILSFTYAKLDGYLNSFGGHTDGIWDNNTVTIDGKETGTFTEMDSAFVTDDEEDHVVTIKFTTPKDKSPESSLFIQPNRGDFDTVTIQIKDIYLIEAELLETDKTEDD